MERERERESRIKNVSENVKFLKEETKNANSCDYIEKRTCKKLEMVVQIKSNNSF